MSQDTLLAQIKIIVSAVAGIGAVHDYERYSRSMSEWIVLMASGGKTNAWTISREKTDPERDSDKTNRCRHTFKIRGYYAIDDAGASEKTFQGLVELVRKAFNNKETLNGTALVSDPVRVDYVGIKELAPESNYFIHTAELSLVADEREWL